MTMPTNSVIPAKAGIQAMNPDFHRDDDADYSVIPAKAGIQAMNPDLHRDDDATTPSFRRKSESLRV
jgi:hypothetical protein